MRALVLSMMVAPTIASPQLAEAQSSARPLQHLSVADLEGRRAQAEHEVIAGVVLLVSVLGFGGGSLAAGLASQRWGRRCGGGFIIGDSWGAPEGGACVGPPMVIGHDGGLLGTSVFLAALGALSVAIGASLVAGGRRTLRRVDVERRLRADVGLGASTDGATMTLRVTF